MVPLLAALWIVYLVIRIDQGKELGRHAVEAMFSGSGDAAYLSIACPGIAELSEWSDAVANPDVRNCLPSHASYEWEYFSLVADVRCADGGQLVLVFAIPGEGRCGPANEGLVLVSIERTGAGRSTQTLFRLSADARRAMDQ